MKEVVAVKASDVRSSAWRQWRLWNEKIATLYSRNILMIYTLSEVNNRAGA